MCSADEKYCHVPCSTKSYWDLSGKAGLEYFLSFSFSEVSKFLSREGCEICILDLLFFIANAGQKKNPSKFHQGVDGQKEMGLTLSV